MAKHKRTTKSSYLSLGPRKQEGDQNDSKWRRRIKVEVNLKNVGIEEENSKMIEMYFNKKKRRGDKQEKTHVNTQILWYIRNKHLGLCITVMEVWALGALSISPAVRAHLYFEVRQRTRTHSCTRVLLLLRLSLFTIPVSFFHPSLRFRSLIFLSQNDSYRRWNSTQPHSFHGVWRCITRNTTKETRAE